MSPTRFKSLWTSVFVLLFASFFVVSTAKADDLYARIRGTVTDSTGAVLPNIVVSTTNTDTNISYKTTSRQDGNYEFLALPTGHYKVTVSDKSFKTFTASGITLELNQNFVQNIKMELGAATEIVEVNANAVQVETTNTQLGRVVDGKTIVDLPLNGRNWIQLQQLQPGVVSSSDRFGSNYATNGSQSQQNSYLINGQDANDLPLNTPLVIPSPDAIGEFNLVTNTINPEYGRNSGAVLNAIIKGGTNSFHGSAFEFYRDSFLNTKNYFSKSPAVFHQNQFGGTIGGPIYKDHSFFFFSYQGTRARQQQAGFGNVTVFSAAQRAGIFGTRKNDKPDKKGNVPVSPFPITANGITFPAGTPYNTIFGGAGKFNIDASSFNPIAVNLLQQFVPLPNAGSNQFQFNPITTSLADQYIGRVDHTFNSHDSVAVYAFQQHNPSQDTIPFTGSTLPGFPEQASREIKQYTASWNHIFSSTTLNEARLGYTRFNFAAVVPVKPVLPSSVGFTGITPQNPAGAGLPTVAVSGLFTLGFTDNGPQPRKDQTYQFTDNFSKVIGHHTLKAGFEMRRFHVSNPFFGQNNGHFDFSGTGSFSTGNPGVDYLLGIPDGYGQGSGGFIDASAQEYYSYVQDQYKVRPNVTLNYGVGYQIDTPLSQNFNKGVAINCFRPGQQSKVFPTAPAGLVFPGDPGCNSSGYSTKYDHFGPRFGIAYSPDWGWISGGPGKTSIRAGYGLYYNRSEEELTLQNLGTPPFGLSSAGVGDIGGSPSFANPFVDISGAGSLANKFPFTVPSPGTPVDFSFFEPLSISVIDPKFSVPYSQNYNLTVQRELPAKMIMTVGYVGAQGRKLITAFELNPGINPAGCAANPTCVRKRTIQNALFPNNFRYPGDVFGSIGQQTTNGTSNYNALQVSVSKSPTHGINFLASYTYSHSLDNGSGFENSGFGGSRGRGTNPFNHAADYADSSFDARHRFVISYTYAIPSLRNVAGFSWLPARVVEGFRVTGITTLQGGFPVGIRDRGVHSLTCPRSFEFYACPDNPNVIGAVNLLDPRHSSLVNNTPNGTGASKDNYFFDPNLFGVPTNGTFGNARRNFFHGPGLNNTDLAIFKDTYITESKYIEMRLEAFNVFNHTQFQNPNNDFNNSNFGRVTSANDPRLVQLGIKLYF